MTMSKRYREPLDEVELAGQVPTVFRWRGRCYQVVAVLGHWHEDEGWWRRGDGTPERIERTDLWRVEARNGSRGVYELVRRGDTWRLDRIWD